MPKLVPKLIKVWCKSRANFKTANIASHDNTFTNNAALLRVSSSEAQLKAKEVLRRDLGDQYVVALNLAPTTPEWLQNWGETNETWFGLTWWCPLLA